MAAKSASGLGQLRLERLEALGHGWLVVLEHDHVVAEVGLDGSHDVARLERVDVVEQGVGELGDHRVAVEVAQVAALGAAAQVVAVLLGHGRERCLCAPRRP